MDFLVALINNSFLPPIYKKKFTLQNLWNSQIQYLNWPIALVKDSLQTVLLVPNNLKYFFCKWEVKGHYW